MEIERILAMGDTDKGTLSMILSNRIDFFVPEINSAAISVRKFGENAGKSSMRVWQNCIQARFTQPTNKNSLAGTLRELYGSFMRAVNSLFLNNLQVFCG